MTDKPNPDLITLNENNIPDSKFLTEVDNYQCKLSEEIVKLICKDAGVVTSDPRVYKLMSIAAQQFIEEIVADTADSIISKKNNNKFLENKELTEVLKEKGFNTNKSQYYCDNLNINLDKNI